MESSALSNVDLTSEFYTDTESNPSNSLLQPPAATSGPLHPAISNSSATPVGTTDPSSESSFTQRLCACLSVEYYRPYFDVNTSTVLARIKSSVTPWNADMFASTPEFKPDLYGPFWLATSLVFFIAGESNLNSYLAHASSEYKRDFTLLSIAATMIYVYAFGIPLGLWGLTRYSGVTVSFLHVVSLYGYALTSFVLASFVCVIPASWLQWIVVLLAIAISGAVLGRNLRATLTTAVDVEAQTGDGSRKTVTALLAGALVVHFVFGLLLKLFFFQGADLAPATVDNAATPAPQ